MFCPQCAAPNPEGARWCSQCGAPMHAGPGNAAAGPVPPAYVPPPPPPPRPPVYVKSHAGLAFFSLLCGLCCCFPGLIFAIVSLTGAMSVNGRLAAQDFAGAQAASRRASFWGWLAILAGVVGLAGQIVAGVFYGHEIMEAVNRSMTP